MSRSRSDIPLATVVINNYNYARYLGEAIESALAQTHSRVEVVVVDDGSLDDSAAVIQSYGRRITPVLKPNGGQASALNAGTARASGDAVYLLDADDRLHPDAVAKTIGLFEDRSVVKVHWPMEVIGPDGKMIGRQIHGQGLPDGDYRAQACQRGPNSLGWPPTSGNCVSRRYLQSVLPIPEEPFKIGADTYLFELAPFAGTVRAFSTALSDYRVHSANRWHPTPFEDKLHHWMIFYDAYSAKAAELCARQGHLVSLDTWQSNSWSYRLRALLDDVESVVPEDASLLLAGANELGIESTSSRRILPFLERNGVYWGPPSSDAHALEELERALRRGVDFIGFAWPASWWLEHYAAFAEHLRSTYRLALRGERVTLFDLRPRIGDARPESRSR